MTCEDQAFVVDVVVTNLPWKIIHTSAINQPTNANAKLKAIAKIRKYKGLYKKHHFIPMAT
jgi:hypothetical protein